MSLANLTPEDWAALASVPEGATKVSGLDDTAHDRLEDAGIVYPFDTRLTSFGRGVIAAARVLVPRLAAETIRSRMAASSDVTVRMAVGEPILLKYHPAGCGCLYCAERLRANGPGPGQTWCPHCHVNHEVTRDGTVVPLDTRACAEADCPDHPTA